MKLSFKNLAEGILVSALGILTIFSPFFSLIGYNDPRPGNSISESGFDLISMESPYFFAGNRDEMIRFLVIFIGVLSIVLCVYGIVMAVIGVLGIFYGKLRSARKGLSVAALVLLALYSFSGIIYWFIYVDTSSGGIRLFTSSAAYLAVLFGFVLYLFFCICRKLTSENMPAENKNALSPNSAIGADNKKI